MSNCSHEEAGKIFMKAKEPIIVEVKRRDGTTPANSYTNEYCQQVFQDETNSSPSSCSREVQTDTTMANNWLGCENYNTLSSEENLIFPDFEYEVRIASMR